MQKKSVILYLVMISLLILIVLRGSLVTAQSELCIDAHLLEESGSSSFDDLVATVGDGSGGLFYEIKPSNEEEFSLIGFNVYQTSDNTAPQYTFRIYYPKGPDNEDLIRIRYMVILNEQQIPAFEGSSDAQKIFYDVALNPGEQTSFTITFPTLSTGMYDIVVLGIPYIDKEPQPGGDTRNFYSRQTLIVGDAAYTENHRAFVELSPHGLVSNNDPVTNLMLTLDLSLLGWAYPDSSLRVNSDRNLDFIINAGYSLAPPANVDQDQTQRFALITFLDYIQHPLIPIEKNVLYAEVGYDTAYSQIKATLDPATIEGTRHEILAVRIDNPGRPMCTLTASPDEVFSAGVSTIRVAIDKGTDNG